MPKLTFFKPIPSTYEFKSGEAAANFANDQSQHWLSFIQPLRAPTDDNFSSTFLADRWNEFSGRARTVSKDKWPDLQHLALTGTLVPFDSELGYSIREIGETYGGQALSGAMRTLASESHNSALRFLNLLHLVGITQIAGMMPPASRPSQNGSKAFRARLEALDTEAAATLTKINDLEDSAQQQLEQLQALHTEQEASYEKWHAGARDQLTKQFNDWEDEWENLRTALVEDLRVRAPVVFWNEQAAKHEEKARLLRDGSWITGSVGFAIVALTATLVVRWIASAKPFNEQPTVQLFSMIAAVALISSMYLWLMRLVVRFYVSEMHLATDASSRAALTTTYLALLKEDAVKPEDRAIVLAALFRPPQDGMVKDDGMPMMSAGALMSGLLGGKPGQP